MVTTFAVKLKNMLRNSAKMSITFEEDPDVFLNSIGRRSRKWF